MLRQLKNLLFGLRTYTDLSPDVKIRKEVNQLLCQREALTLDEWFNCFWQPRGIAKPVVAFVYNQLGKYSGLEIARVRPSDRLNGDLQLPLVCWFDWQIRWCEDFCECFGVDISDRFDMNAVTTVEELVLCLDGLRLTVKAVSRINPNP